MVYGEKSSSFIYPIMHGLRHIVGKSRLQILVDTMLFSETALRVLLDFGSSVTVFEVPSCRLLVRVVIINKAEVCLLFHAATKSPCCLSTSHGAFLQLCPSSLVA